MAKTVYKLINDAQLFAQLAAGSETAFDAIFLHYKPRIAAFVQKMVRSDGLAEEITQDVFVQLWLSRSYLADVTHHTSYLFQIATNKTLDYQKKISNKERLLDRIAHGSTEICNDTEEQILFQESTQIIELAIAALPEQRKLIYQLSREEGLTHEQITERLNISRSTVNNQLVKALSHIRTYLQKRTSIFSYAIFVLLTSGQ
ncbi:RNA polymerase sigma factor [Parapedobacter sp. DT-150]|uniref:RNA polymerase sigma factor n=1 Tax=Parapedobacter sp. DT-150 TaxID=3396162 RepID=UPI003F1ADC94